MLSRERLSKHATLNALLAEYSAAVFAGAETWRAGPGCDHGPRSVPGVRDRSTFQPRANETRRGDVCCLRAASGA